MSTRQTLLALFATKIGARLKNARAAAILLDRRHGDSHHFTESDRWRTKSNVRNVQVAIRSERHRGGEKQSAGDFLDRHFVSRATLCP